MIDEHDYGMNRCLSDYMIRMLLEICTHVSGMMMCSRLNMKLLSEVLKDAMVGLLRMFSDSEFQMYVVVM